MYVCGVCVLVWGVDYVSWVAVVSGVVDLRVTLLGFC